MKRDKASRLRYYIERLESTPFSYISGFTNDHKPCHHECRDCGHVLTERPRKVKRGSQCKFCFPELGRESGAAHVYVMVSKGWPCVVKIGFSRYLEHRHKVLKVRTPFQFNLFGKKLMTVSAARGMEHRAHLKLKHCHAGLNGFDGSNEWYHLTAETATLLDELHFDFISDNIFSAATMRLTKRRDIL